MDTIEKVLLSIRFPGGSPHHALGPETKKNNVPWLATNTESEKKISSSFPGEWWGMIRKKRSPYSFIN
jgi:hypothetical protein